MQKLRNYMTKNGLTEVAMAEQVGVNQSTINRLLNGAKPTIDVAVKLAQVTNNRVPVTSWVQE